MKATTAYESLALRALSDLVVDGDETANKVEVDLWNSPDIGRDVRRALEMERPFRAVWTARMVATSLGRT